MGGTNTIINGTTGTTSTTGITTLATIGIPSAGVWLITGCVCSYSGTSNMTFTISGNTSLDLRNCNNVAPGTYGNISVVMFTTSSVNMYLIAAQTGAVITVNPIWVHITRIA